ncbi:uncharacterized protein LOC104445904 [Eucalyptus grandis]|uniref:uncharacterized protein LOC104445904 n=1 Tax=Eucalyptus grandis TaxID=71139 RepID=UPI00192EF9AA|nr:uncharacterized protein LOC104445904 [Eucalyptus grandis]
MGKLLRKGYELGFAPPISIGRKSVVRLSDNAKYAGDPKWDKCLVGYYVGKNVPFRITELALKQAWGAHLAEVLANDDGFYFFIIPDDEFRRKILDGGHLTVARVPLVLKQWHRNMELKKELQSSVSVWIRLKNIPFAYWSASGISEIASAVGRPLYVDPLTEKMKRLSFARVCVEISAKLEKCEQVEVLVDDESFSVKGGAQATFVSTATVIPAAAKPTVVKYIAVNTDPTLSSTVAADPVQLISSASEDGWKQVTNRKKKQNAGQMEAITTPPSSDLKAKAIEGQSNQSDSDDQNSPRVANEESSKALVISNPNDASTALSPNEDLEDGSSGVSSSSSEGEDTVRADPSHLDDPQSSLEAPPNQKYVPKAAVSKTPVIAPSKGRSKRRPSRR